MSTRLQVPEILVGGQAVWEGVMMRSPYSTALAVRQASGGIEVRAWHDQPISSRYRFLRLPILRGMAALWDSLVLGMKALNLSLQLDASQGEKVSRGQTALSLILALALVVLLFFVFPFFLSRFLVSWISPRLVTVVEGVLRLMIFFGYLWGVSLIPEVKQVLFQYHGAEHKVVHAFEHGEPLTAENAQKYPTMHPRCSTSFLIVVLIISFVFFVFLDFYSWQLRLLSRLFFLPLIAGISFELIRLFALYPNHILTRIVVYPGLMTQKLTTAEPTTAQLDVAIAALQASLGA
jgi:uncharacterized protein YqhQ